MGHCKTYVFQAVKGVRAIKDAILDMFGRIEAFFRRLEIYIEVELTTGMLDKIIQILCEVISILGIATKNINQGQISEYSVYKYATVH